MNIWEEFKVLSRFIQKWIQLLLIGMTVCLESFLPIGCRTFICWKNPPKCSSILVWIADCWFSSNILLTSRNPRNNCWISRIFGVWFGGKDRGLCPYNPWSHQVGGLDAFLYEAAQNVENFSKIKIKKSKTYSGWSLFQGLSNVTTLRLIQSGQTLPLKGERVELFNGDLRPGMLALNNLGSRLGRSSLLRKFIS